MQHLQPNTTLQSGKYRIEKVLGQGGFGITYLAENTMLDGKVAIKEFFFKEYCNRDETTSHVTIPTAGNQDIVDRFKQKFIKEAKTIFRLNHPNIVRILDIFEENGTAYYVMEHIDGESLGDMVKRRGALPQQEAIGYIKEAGLALSYIHSETMNHLDIKPNNLMKRQKDNKIIVIDFGVAKQYDATTSEGTTTTPVGISHGYSPAEQYQQFGVQSFSPQSDVYALAATLYKLLTGVTPPEAMRVQDEGLPLDELQKHGVSSNVISAIEHAMLSRSKRTQTVDAFLQALDNEDDDRTIPIPPTTNPTPPKPETPKPEEQKQQPETQKTEPEPEPIAKKNNMLWLWVALAVMVIGGGIFGIARLSNGQQKKTVSTKFITNSNVYTVKVGDVSFNMVKVEGGTFTMGATSEQGSDAYSEEKPTHSVTLSSFSIGETEVTQALWEAVMGENPSSFKGNPQCPVENVSWNDCQDFISKLNNLLSSQLGGKRFRLPTEAEWEFAARGGNKSKGYKYCGSNNLGDVAWYDGNSNSQTHPVKQKQANELGIYDMSGNVWEWCSDWYDEDYYSVYPICNPKGPSSGSYRVIRGGSWDCNASYCRSSFRVNCSPGRELNYLGLRLALSE